MAKFFPPWPDSQKPLISVWKHLGSFSVSRGNKIGLIWRYSEDWPFQKAQELLLTLLSVLQGEQQLCPPAHPHCWRGSPGLHIHELAAPCICSHLPFLLFQSKGLGIWLGAFRVPFTPLQFYCRELICCLTTQSLFPPSSCGFINKCYPLSCSAAPPFIFGARLGSDRPCVVQLVLPAGKCKNI